MAKRRPWPPADEVAVERLRLGVHAALAVLEHAPAWLVAEHVDHFQNLGAIAERSRLRVGVDARTNETWHWDGARWSWRGPVPISRSARR